MNWFSFQQVELLQIDQGMPNTARRGQREINRSKKHVT